MQTVTKHSFTLRFDAPHWPSLSAQPDIVDAFDEVIDALDQVAALAEQARRLDRTASGPAAKVRLDA